MRGAPMIQAVLITVALCLLGFTGLSFIQGGVQAIPEDKAAGVAALQDGEIPVEIECYFSDKPESYSFSRPEREGENTDGGILKSSGSNESPVFHDLVLKSKADNVLWLDVTWADEKPHGNYFVQLVISVGNEEPLTLTYRSHSSSLQGTIELDLTNLKNDD